MAGPLRILYNFSLIVADALTGLVAPLLSPDSNSKTIRFIKGRENLIKNISENLQIDINKRTIWVHASSLGEFAIARPIVKVLKEEYNIVITFFSPSGYDVVKKYGNTFENVFYLPWDTPSNVHKFLDIVKPSAAIFMVSEYWHNYLSELKKRSIPTFLVSAIIRQNSIFFKWYGDDYRNTLRSFSTIFVLDKRSVDCLKTLGITNVTLAGNPLFDNAYEISKQPYRNEVIEQFKGEKDLFVAGSISDANDLKLITSLANEYQGTRFIIVPHAISKKKLYEIIYHLKGKSVLYSECSAGTDFSNTQTLIIDFIGDLAKIYRYGKWAYVGGGFTPYLHSVIEATVYGIPVSFGPRIGRKATPRQLIELGIGAKVSNYNQLKEWFSTLYQNDESLLSSIKTKAMHYVAENLHSTEKIVNRITSVING